MKALFTSLLTLLSFVNFTFTQCDITNVQWTFGACSSNGTYSSTIDFDHPNPNQEFSLQTPYNQVSFKTSELPITFDNIPGYCSGPNMLYTLTTAINGIGCVYSGATPYQCCPNLNCGIQTSGADYTFCESYLMGLLLNFFEFGCLQGQTYDAIVYKKLNNIVIDSFYFPNNLYNPNVQNNYVYVNIPAQDCNSDYSYKIRDVATGVSDESPIPHFCCEECGIVNFNAYPDYNNCNNNQVNLIFNFQNLGSFGLNGYTVSDGVSTQTYTLNDPKIFIHNYDCASNVNLTIQDINQPLCSSSIDLGIICCPCELIDINITPDSCVNGAFDLSALIDVEGGCELGGWTATVENNLYPMAQNGSSYGAYGVTAQDSIVDISLCSDIEPNFCIQTSFLNPCFIPTTNPNDTCMITNFTVSQNYTCIGETAELSFNFTAQDFGLNGYYVIYGGNSSLYSLSDPKVLYPLASCDSGLYLQIVDVNYPYCQAIASIPALCCPCTIDSLEVNASACNQGLFDISVYLQASGGSCINGSWTASVGANTYNLLWTNNQYEAYGIFSQDSLVAINICSEFGECYNDTIVNPCFNSTPLPCSLTSFNLIESNICQGAFMTNSFNFQGINFGLNGYTISDGLNSYNYTLGSPTSIDCPAMCNGSTVYTITDILDNTCSLTDTVALCCPCTYDSISLATSICDSNTFSISIYFSNLNGFCSLGPWSLITQDTSYGVYNNGNGLYFVNNVSSADSLIFISLCTSSGPGYCITDTLVSPCFNSGGGTGNLTCTISNINMSIDTSAGGNNVLIELTNNNYCGETFKVWINNEYVGEMEFNDNKLLMPISNTSSAMLLFKVCSNNAETVCIESMMVNPYFINSIFDELTDVNLKYGNGLWEISNQSNEILDIKIIDLLGRMVYIESIHEITKNFILKPTAGLFIVTISNKRGKYKNWKVFVD